MDEFFGELERFGSEYIYPNRFIIIPIVVVAILGALAFAWRLRLYRPLLEHKYITAAIGIPLLAIAIPVGWYMLSPLWESSFLEEAAPEFHRAAVTETASESTATPPPAATAEPAATSEAGASAENTPATAADASGESTADSTGEGEGGAQLVALGEWQGADDFHTAEGAGAHHRDRARRLHFARRELLRAQRPRPLRLPLPATPMAGRRTPSTSAN